MCDILISVTQWNNFCAKFPKGNEPTREEYPQYEIVPDSYFKEHTYDQEGTLRNNVEALEDGITHLAEYLKAQETAERVDAVHVEGVEGELDESYQIKKYVLQNTQNTRITLVVETRD
jgi:hypothetical protein